MKKFTLFVLFALVVLFVAPSYGQTVGHLIASRPCSTAGMAGLSNQIARAVNCIKPGILSSLQGTGVVLRSKDAIPWLQTEAIKGIKCAMQKKNDYVMTLNSAYRTLNQQLALYKWQPNCGIYVAARPGSSNHEAGRAIDVTSPDYWHTPLTQCGYTRLGPHDPVHFDYKGGQDIRSTSVLAFQRLWNVNNPGDRIAEDGIYGPATEARLMRSPVGGFARNIC